MLSCNGGVGAFCQGGLDVKNLYLIGGPMGAGKTTVCQLLKKRLERSVFLDGDWCWDSDPFAVTEETKSMVLSNIRFLLGQFLACSAYRNVIFCWVMHRQSIIDSILQGLDLHGCSVKSLSLVCSDGELEKRLRKDLAAGIRAPDVLERSLQRAACYGELATIRIDTTGLTPNQVAELIARL